MLTFVLQPPKRKYTNYKELQEVRKKEKVEKQDANKLKVSSCFFFTFVSSVLG